MSTLYRALPINNITDELLSLDGTIINELILTACENSGGDLWPQTGGDNLWNACFIGDSDISATFKDSSTGENYTVSSEPFIGPRPAHHPHVN